MNLFRKIFAAILVTSLIVGCQSKPGATTPPQPANSSGQATVPTTQASGRPAPGTPMADPAQTLGQLPAYQASLRVSFSGTQAGQASQWSQTYHLAVAHDPNARLLAYEESGLDPTAPAYPAFSGYAKGIDYYRAAAGDACVGNFAQGDADPSGLPEPASLLPKASLLYPTGPGETVNDLAATPYSLDETSFTGIASAKAKGQVWLASQGGAVLKYQLEIDGGTDFFDRDTQGTITWEYEMQPLAPGVALLPADCPLPLPEVPLTDDAQNTVKFPGYTSFETGMDLQGATDFYTNTLPGAGFTPAGDPQIGAVAASLAFSKDGQTIAIFIENQGVTQVTISIKPPQQATEAGAIASPTPNQIATSVAGSPQMRVMQSLTALNGSDDQPSVFPSYHLDYASQQPAWDDGRGAILQKESRLAADVQGKNIHFTSSAGDVGKSEEVYLIGDQEYDVVNGTPTLGLGMAALTWAMWPLDVVMTLGVSTLKTVSAGTDTIDGRAAEVYQISGSTADDPTGLMAGLGSAITRSDGQVWVDQESGGLLKLQIEYEMEVKDTSGAVQGKGQGSLQISVTQVGQVSVELK